MPWQIQNQYNTSTNFFGQLQSAVYRYVCKSLTAMVMDRRKDPKLLPQGYQERRRLAALEKQKNARKELATRARKLALAAAESEGSSDLALEDAEVQDVSSGTPSSADHRSPAQQLGAGTPTTSGRPTSGSAHPQAASPSPGRQLRKFYSEQLMQPEWLIEIPADLGEDWYAMPRPEGRRCLVVASKGHTTARLRNGALFERFHSALPAGGPGTPAGAEMFSILDCIFHEPDQTYYVMDLLCWKGYGLYDCSSEFRLFWLGSKLGETGAGEAAGAAGSAHARRFLPLPTYRCTPEGLAAAHGGGSMHSMDSAPFTQDGVYLLHREAHYHAGPTPLALLWKDAGCSRYVVDTDQEGTPLPHQVAVLEYRMDGTVATNDDPPVVLGRMPPSFLQQMGPKLRAGRLLKFRIGGGGVYFQEGQPVGADLHYEGVANQRRGRADSLSKVVFQHQARTAPISLQQLLDAAAADAARQPSTSQQQEAGDGMVLGGQGSTVSMSVVMSDGGKGEGGGCMQTDGGGHGVAEGGGEDGEVEMG